jgi:hypothetical protein
MSPIASPIVPPLRSHVSYTLGHGRLSHEPQTDRGPRTRRLRPSVVRSLVDVTLGMTPVPPSGSVASSALLPAKQSLRASRTSLFASPATLAAISKELGVVTTAAATVKVTLDAVSVCMVVFREL